MTSLTEAKQKCDTDKDCIGLENTNCKGKFYDICRKSIKESDTICVLEKGKNLLENIQN